MEYKKIRILFLVSILSLWGITKIHSQDINIIPRPNELMIGKGTFILNSQATIMSSVQSMSAARILQDHIQEVCAFQVAILNSGERKKASIKFKSNEKLGKEAYELSVTRNSISISASGDAGWFYGIQSLVQLFPAITDSLERPLAIKIPEVTIKDKPRFEWRAFMLDEARHFRGMGQVKMLLDEMAYMKMNVFHWHLVDDQGWRIEIKKYPLLTEIGSKRRSTQVGPLKWKSPIQSGEPHQGFYTQQEIKEIIEYAEQRHITIVPEIEMPGHSTSAIASYPWLGTLKKKQEVPIKFGKGKDVYDVSSPRVYEFLTDVLDEVMELFPSKVIHIGGDEVKYSFWKESETVQAYMKEKKLASPADLQIYFTNNISQYLQGKGKRMMGWNEIMGYHLEEDQNESDAKTNQNLAKETIVHFWKGDVAMATHAASNGYDMVNSMSDYTYLDYSYKGVPLSKAYSFDPIPSELDLKFHDKVIGLGCQMWGEWIPTIGQMHFQVFPRIAAYAEVGWTQKENKNYDKFQLALQKLKRRWGQKGIYYASDIAIEKVTE